MNITDEKLREGYWYILRNPKGYLMDLDKIDENIAYGITSRADLRYRVTDDGLRIARVDYTALTMKLFREKNGYIRNMVTGVIDPVQ